MKNSKLLLLSIVLMLSSTILAQLKNIGNITYYQLPTKGIMYEKVDAYVTLDQSDARDMLGSAAIAASDITTVYDSWPLCPDYIKADKGKGILRLEVKYKPDHSRRPITPPTLNSQRGGYVVPYKVFSSMTVTDSEGNVIMERNYGELSGNYVSGSYIEARDTEDGVGTYEMACIRAAMNKARAELFGLYGFGLMTARLDMGPIKEIKASKKPGVAVITMLKNKKGFVLNDSEKEILKTFVDIIETNIGLASDKTRWAAYHNLAVGYTWLQDEAKAKEYLAKEFEESKSSIELVRNFGKKGSKGYVGKDLRKFQSYVAIEEFVNYYAAGANKYPSLLAVLANPLKQFTDFYTHNDLLCQIYGLDIFYQFLPLTALKGAPKSVNAVITQNGREPITYTLKFDKYGNAKELKVKSINIAGDKINTKGILPVFNKDGDYVAMTVSGMDLVDDNADKKDLRRMSAPVNNLTKSETSRILKGDGALSTFVSSEKNQMLLDLEGMMYFKGESKYPNPNAFYSKFLQGSDTKFGKAKSSTIFTATTQINPNGVVNQWKWNGKAHMGWGISFASTVATEKNKVDGTISRDFKVTELDENGFPKSISIDSEVKAKLVAKSLDWKKIKDQYSSYSNFWKGANKPKVSASENGFEAISSEIWPCTYKVDANGNWTESTVGPYTITRTFKY